MYRNLLLYLLYGSEIWSHAEGGDKRMLRTIFGPRRNDVTESGEDCIKKSFMISASQQIFLG